MPGDFNDAIDGETIVDLIRKNFNQEAFGRLTCKRWKDGIDIDHPTFAIEQFVRDIRALTRPEPDRREVRAWRYEIQYGPDGEMDYAWVYDEQNSLVCTAKTHHAKLIVDRSAILSAGLVPDEAAIRADEREKCAHTFEVRRNLCATDAEIVAAIRNGGQK